MTRRSWKEKVFDADALWQQIREALARENIALPLTPRRPDVRMILDNVAGAGLVFKNPANHAGDKSESIPADGAKKAVMLMVQGATLEEQYKNAETLFSTYDLGNEGMSLALVEDMAAGKLSHLIAEAYGPALFADQASKLVDLSWTDENQNTSLIKPVKGVAGAYGARAATEEMVFLAHFPLFVKGTTTIAEMVESNGIAVAIREDAKNKAQLSRPIVASVAKTYYGTHFDQIPCATVYMDGTVLEIDMRNGTIIEVTLDETGQYTVAQPVQKLQFKK